MRIREAKCSTCVWMRGHGGENGVEFLTCQFNAPRDNGAITAFALVTGDDFCREWDPIPPAKFGGLE